jgi:hypothetical protein
MQSQQKRKISDEGAKLFNEFIAKEIYEIPKNKLPEKYSFKNSVRHALNCVSPAAIGVPPAFMIEMFSIDCKTFTLQTFHILKQIMAQATGRAMGLQPTQYCEYIQVLEILNEDFAKVWNGTIERFETEYPYVDEPVLVEVEHKTEGKAIDFPVTGQA